MVQLTRAFASGLLLAGLLGTAAAADNEPAGDLSVSAPDTDVAVAPGDIAVTPTEMPVGDTTRTRSLPAPIVVDPFASAAPAAAQSEVVPPLAQSETPAQRLPPGPASRWP